MEQNKFTYEELELLRLACVSAKYEARQDENEDIESKYADLQNKIVEIQLTSNLFPK